MRNRFENQQLILLQVIDFLEKHRQNFNEEKLHYFIPSTEGRVICRKIVCVSVSVRVKG